VRFARCEGRRFVRKAAEDQDFLVYPFEWWHFDYRDWTKYPILNLTFEQLSHTEVLN
jgi:D-alanyl-D-alanine dipeptidase